MFTNNFIKLMGFFAVGPNSTASCTIADGSSVTIYNETFTHFRFVDWMGCGRCQTITAKYSGSASNSPPENLTNPGVYFGTGATPATASDYTLENPITSGLNVLSGSPALHSSNGSHTYTATHTLTNTTDSEINIYELGLFLPVDTTSTAGKYLWANTLAERTVLTEPITIAPGESKLVTYKITFNHG